jgi:hypothetical protein
MRFNRSNGVYYGDRRERLLGRAYDVVIQRPAFDAPWTLKWIGFAPLSAAGQGFEPQLPDPESGVLPLDDPATGRAAL